MSEFVNQNPGFFTKIFEYKDYERINSWCFLNDPKYNELRTMFSVEDDGSILDENQTVINHKGKDILERNAPHSVVFNYLSEINLFTTGQYSLTV